MNRFDNRDEKDIRIEELEMQKEWLEKARAHWEKLSDAADHGMDLMQGELQELREALRQVVEAFDNGELNSEALHAARALIRP